MVERSVPRGGAKHGRPSTRSIVADDGLCAQVAGCLGMDASAARRAFAGEPVKEVLAMVEWAMKHQDEDGEDFDVRPALLSWAHKRGRGAFREGGRRYRRCGECGGAFRAATMPEDGLCGACAEDRDRFERLARDLARMWVENPRSLAAAVRALERERDGNGRS